MLIGFFDVDRYLSLEGIKAAQAQLESWRSGSPLPAGTIVYVNAGKQLAQIDNLSGILSGYARRRWSLSIHPRHRPSGMISTLSEANKYAAGEWKRAHAPQKLLAWIERYHNWKRR